MELWLLVALLYADGQTKDQIGLQLDMNYESVNHLVRCAKGKLLGIDDSRTHHDSYGVGTKLDLRRVLVEDGWLTE